MVDPGANINCVGYALVCGSVKAAGGYSFDVKARVLLKISWPRWYPLLSINQWFYIIHGEDEVVLGTPACRALVAIDDQWPLSVC